MRLQPGRSRAAESVDRLKKLTHPTCVRKIPFPLPERWSCIPSAPSRASAARRGIGAEGFASTCVTWWAGVGISREHGGLTPCAKRSTITQGQAKPIDLRGDFPEAPPQLSGEFPGTSSQGGTGPDSAAALSRLDQ
jgi:hypothetical protein